MWHITWTSGKPGDLVLEQCGKKLHKVLEQYGIKTADLVFEQGVKLELELLVKYCDNELIHVQLWDFAQYSTKHLDIKNVDLQFVILENFVSSWGTRFELHVKFKGVTYKQFYKLGDSWFGIVLLLATRLHLFLVLLECSCWSSTTKHLGSLSMEKLACSKGFW